MTSITSTTNASRTERNMRNRSTTYVGGKAVHVAIKRDRQQEKFGASKRHKRVISLAIMARQTKQWAIIEGDLTLHGDCDDAVWIEDFTSTLATPSREYIDTRTPAQEGKDHEMQNEANHLKVNGRRR
jgi:hypothetical protein